MKNNSVRKLGWLTIASFLPVMTAAAQDTSGVQVGVLDEKLDQLNVRVRTKHYQIAGTVNDGRLKEYGRALEFIHGHYERGFGELLGDKAKPKRELKSQLFRPAENEDAGPSQSHSTPPETETGANARTKGRPPPVIAAQDIRDNQDDPDAPFRVIIFANKKEYDCFGRQYLGGSEFTRGMFVPKLNLLLVRDDGNFNDTYEVLFHEAFHQFMHRHMKNPPTWLNEGLATHYGYARPTGGGLNFRNPDSDFWKIARQIIQDKQTIGLAEVISAAPGTFKDKTKVDVSGFKNVTRGALYYAESYTFVHMLLHDKKGKERLREYLRALANDENGSRARDITLDFFGPNTCKDLMPHWVKYVKSNPETK